MKQLCINCVDYIGGTVYNLWAEEEAMGILRDVQYFLQATPSDGGGYQKHFVNKLLIP